MKHKLRLMVLIAVFLVGYITLTPSDNEIIAQGGTGKCDELGVEADFCQTIDDENPFWEYSFRVRNRGSLIQIDMAHVQADSELDTYLYLVDQAGNIVAENDDRRRGDPTSFIEYPQAAAGVYRIIAGRYGLDGGDTTGDFQLNIRLVPPSELVITDTGYRVTDGSLLDVGYPLFSQPRPKAKWTILAYYGGDNNLEVGLINDFHEFELAGGSNEEVRIVALLDRSLEYDETNGNWTGAKLFEIQAGTSSEDGLVVLSSEMIADLGYLNTASGQSLAQFLVWGMRYYPAENYVVALGSHGAGWQGVITDDSVYIGSNGVYALDENGKLFVDSEGAPLIDEKGVPLTDSAGFLVDFGGNRLRNSSGQEINVGTLKLAKDIITGNELRQALTFAIEEAKLQNPTFDKFAFLINDACLMSSVEFFAITKDFFNYALASPEIVVDPAHDMSLFTQYMNNNLTAPDFGVVGQDLVEKYITQDILLRQGSGTEYLTSVVTNLRRFGDLETAIEAFAAVVNDKPEVRALTVGLARSNTYVYTNFANSNTKIDLGSFMQRVIAISPDDTELVDAANKVLDELRNIVLYADAGSRVKDRIYYYNVFFPEKSKDLDQAYFYQTPLGEWSRMLRNYFAAVTPKPWTGDAPFHSPVAPKINVVTRYPAEAVSVVNPFYIETETVGRNVAYADLTVDQMQNDGTITRMYDRRLLTPTVDDNGNFVRLNIWNQGVTTYLQNWSVALPTLTDGTTTHFEYMTIGEDIASVDGRYRLPDSQIWNDVTVTLSFDGVLGGVTQRVINKAEGNSALAVITIPTGSVFQTYKYLVTSDGRVSAVEGNTYTWTEDGLTWQFVAAPNGNYNVGLLVTAFGGTTGFVREAVTVDNTGILPQLRAETRPDVGVTIPRLETWTPLSFNPTFTVNELYGDVGVYQTSDPEGNNLVVLMFSFPTEDLTEAVQTAADYNVFTVIGDLTPVTIDGRDALEFYYTRQIGEENRSGRAFAFIQADPVYGDNYGIVLASESIDGQGNFEDFYPTLRDYTNIFDPIAYEASRNPQWRVERLTGEELYYVPVSWERTTPEDARDENGVMKYGVWTRYTPVDGTSTFLAMARYLLTSEVQTTSNVLSNIIAGQALLGAENLLVIQNRPYNGRYHVWDATIYRVVRDGVAYIGRSYTTTVFGITYALWAEVPEDDNTDTVYRDSIETIIDGYQIKVKPPAPPVEAENTEE